MYQSALPEQSKECVWKEDSLWFGAARVMKDFTENVSRN